MSNFLLRIIILIAAVIGLSVSIYLYKKVKKGTLLVCPLGADCDTVIHSEYAYFFGISLEVMGIFYYSIIFISYSIFLLIPSVATPVSILLVLVFSSFGFLFSIYLAFIELWTLRQWCTWCLVSGLSSIVIFTVSFIEAKFIFLPLLIEYNQIIEAIYTLGIALGLGGATIADVLFLKFLKDFKLSMQENSVTKILFQIIWLGLALVVISQVGFYLADATALSLSFTFLAKATIILIIVVNGAFLNLYLAPKLVNISFGVEHNHIPGELLQLRKNAFSMVGISFVSWYSVFLLNYLVNLKLTLAQILGTYIILVFFSIFVSQIIGSLLTKKH